MNVAILSGSVRSNRDGNKVAKFAQRMAEARGWNVTQVDPVEFNLPLLDKMYKEMQNPEPKFVKIHDILSEADGFIIVAAEYNHSIPPALKNLLDHFREEYFLKPSGIISYSNGPFGGVRGAEQLKLICLELKTPPIPTSLPISRVHDSILPDGTSVNGDYERRSKKFFDEFEWYMKALKAQRAISSPY